MLHCCIWSMAYSVANDGWDVPAPCGFSRLRLDVTLLYLVYGIQCGVTMAGMSLCHAVFRG